MGWSSARPATPTGAASGRSSPTGGHERLRTASPTHLRGVACHFLDRIPDAELESLRRTLERVAETA